jgi:DNA-binding transcriptional LysR family regulator
MEWSHLKVVLAVSRAGSLTAAARLLGTDQTTAGRRLTALEDQLGTALFVRSKAGFVPTEPGRIVIANAERVESRLERMRDALVEPDRGVVGIVRLMANTWMLERLAARAGDGLLALHPDLELRMSGRLPPVTLHSEPTISLWFDATARAPDIARPFARLPYATYRSARRETEDACWVRFLDDDAQGPSFSRQIARRTKDAVVRLTATDAGILKAAAAAGIGQAVLPTCLGDEAEDLERVDSAVGKFDRLLHVHLNPDAAPIRRVQVVMDWLTAIVAPAFGAQVLPDRLATKSH